MASKNNDKLIRAGDLFETVCKDTSIRGPALVAIRRHIDAAPAVEAEEVVRCKDCRFWACEFDNVGHCTYAGINLDHADYGFCSYGERREKE